jgi:hypothetical protein
MRVSGVARRPEGVEEDAPGANVGLIARLCEN